MRVDGFLVTHPARTALDMARLHGVWPGMAACDAALRQGVTRADLERAAELMRGWPHKRRIDRAIELADPGAESYLESLARGLVIELGVGTPQTQFGITDGNREAWCDLRLGRHLFEADGLLKYDEDPQGALREEKARQDFLSGFKLGASRITAYDCLRRPPRRAATAGEGVRRHLPPLRQLDRRPRALPPAAFGARADRLTAVAPGPLP